MSVYLRLVHAAESRSTRSTFLATVLKVVYGIGLTEDHDAYASTFDVSAEGISQGFVPGKYIVEVLPCLKNVPKWVPGFGFQADFERWRAAVNDVKNVPFAHAREAMVSGSSSSCFVSGHINYYAPFLNKARGEGLDSIVAKTMAVVGDDEEPEDDHEEMVKGIGLVSYEGKHTLPRLVLRFTEFDAFLFLAGADTVESATASP